MGKYFVAASAEINTWDLSAENVVLAEYGCVDESIMSKMDHIKFIMPSDRWDDCEHFREETSFLDQIQEDVLQRLTDGYNKMWDVTMTTKEVYTLLHPWLDYYIDVMYYKFFTLEDIIDKYKNVYMWGLQETDYYYCDCPMDFMIRVAKDDWMNLQLYTVVAQYKGISLEKLIKKEHIHSSSKEKGVVKYSPYIFFLKSFRFSKRIIKRMIRHMMCSFINFISHRAETIVINPTRFFMSYKELGKMLVRTKCKVGAYYGDFVKIQSVPYDKKIREEFPLNKENASCDFEKFLLKQIASDIPIKCMEEFNNLYQIRSVQKYKRVKRIVSTSDAKCNDSAKAFVLSKRKKCTWYYSEIGGSGDLYYGREEARGEDRIADVYYTNGWTHQPSSSELRPFYNLRFLKAASLNDFSGEKKGIMYGGTFVPRYKCMHANPIGRNPQSYIDNCMNLLESLSMLNVEIVARLYPDAGWRLAKRVQERLPDIIIGDLQEEFTKAVKRCKLYVVDMISTTWGEAYAAGVPIIFVGNRQFESYSPQGEYWVDKLRSCGLYIEDGEIAGKYIASIIDNIENWWSDAARQKTVREFAAIYANLPSNMQKNVWVDEIINISKESIRI